MTCVTELEYRVQRDEKHWTVCYQGQHCGRFATRDEALRSAWEDAARVRRLGHRVHVLLQDTKGCFRLAPELVPPGARRSTATVSLGGQA
ncbi:hypothetical protein [Roseomonas chloroacetimidivorans]|uniref:hypothetical protein n=1 Tax=Roseomonas chloroacetimidivorans TaxID=1766656 RepID=UPI003C763F38